MLCIYHGNCLDGFSSAWVVRKFMENYTIDVTYFVGIYGENPPDVKDQHVLLVDFTYKRPVLEKMAEDAKSIIIIDHHKSAIEDLNTYIKEISLEDALNLWNNEEKPESNITAMFDMNRSGAGMTWDFFNPNKNRPQFINHVEDRDLWKFNLPNTREINACMFSFPYDFESFDKIAKTDISKLYEDGLAIERKHHKDINELLSVVTYKMVIGGYEVPVANLPYTYASDAANKLAENAPFAACYWDGAKRTFSLRSKESGLDVSKIATLYGGGGHKHAAGFVIDRNWEGDIT